MTGKVPSNPSPNIAEGFAYTIRVENLVGPLLSEADLVVLSGHASRRDGADRGPGGRGRLGHDHGTVLYRLCGGDGLRLQLRHDVEWRDRRCDGAGPGECHHLKPADLHQYRQRTTASLDVNPANNSNSGAVQVRASSLAGLVFRDFNDNGTFDANDTGIAGVTMTLSGTDLNGTPVSRTATTGAGGAYAFTFLPQGSYTVTQGTITETYLTARRPFRGPAAGRRAGPR